MDISLQPQVLQWARQRAGLSVSALAKKLATRPEKVEAWEETGRLKLNQAERLAKVTHVPFGYLYFSTPPRETLPVPDFRTLQSAGVDTPSPDLLDIVYDIQRKQIWYREQILHEGGFPLPFIGEITLQTPAPEAADLIRSTIRIVDSLKEVSSAEEGLRLQREHLEEKGILVMQSGIVGNNTRRSLDVREFRGFALADIYVPLIFINGRDSAGAQRFTLMHELVHIWLGLSGVSNPLQSIETEHEVERYCNAVAAELLVPAIEMRKEWERVKKEEEPVTLLARKFKVSSLVILGRARDLHIISRQTFKRLYKETEKAFGSGQHGKEKGGGDFYRTEISRYGRSFVRTVVASTLEGKTPYREALGLLNIRRMDTFKELASKVNING